MNERKISMENLRRVRYIVIQNISRSLNKFKLNVTLIIRKEGVLVAIETLYSSNCIHTHPGLYDSYFRVAFADVSKLN